MKDESCDQLCSDNFCPDNLNSAIAESEALYPTAIDSTTFDSTTFDPTTLESTALESTVLDHADLESKVPNSGAPDSHPGSKPQIIPRPLSNISLGNHPKVRFFPFDNSFPRTYGFSGGFSNGASDGHQAKDHKTKDHSGKADSRRSIGSIPEELQISPPRASRRPTILLIEPDEEKTQQLSANLSVDGYLPVVVSDQYEALRMARLLSIDLVICSLSLVGRDGDYFVRHFRKTPNHADVPVILLTDRTIEDEDAFLKFGADALCVEEEAENSVLALAAFYLNA